MLRIERDADAMPTAVALTTGGSRGLGREMALAFAEAGADVAIASRKLESCETTAKDIEAFGVRAFPVAAHVGYWDQCDALIEAAYARFGRVDILVNNAGTNIRKAPETLSVAEWSTVLNTNLTSAFACSQAVYPYLCEAGGGKIKFLICYLRRGGGAPL